MSNETSQLLSDTVEKLFSDHVTKNCIEEAEKGIWPDTLWNEVVDNGLNLICNVADIIHDPNEVLRKEINEFDCNWSLK